MITQWRYIEDPEIVIAKVWLDQDHGFAIAYDANGNLISGKQGLWITFTDYLLRRIRPEAWKHILYDEFPPEVKPVLRKERPPVSEYEKEIPATLEELKKQEKNLKHYSEPSPCVYFLIHNGETVYIGKTTRALQSRIIAHRKDSGKAFNEVYYISVSQNELEDAEKKFIKTLKPKYNVVHNGGNVAITLQQC